jgi:hypothetical protein
MPSEDEQINVSRHELGALTSKTYVRILKACTLLAGKARLAPSSAEARAFAELDAAKNDLDRWIIQAQKLIGPSTGSGQAHHPSPEMTSPAAIAESDEAVPARGLE